MPLFHAYCHALSRDIDIYQPRRLFCPARLFYDGASRRCAPRRLFNGFERAWPLPVPLSILHYVCTRSAHFARYFAAKYGGRHGRLISFRGFRRAAPMRRSATVCALAASFRWLDDEKLTAFNSADESVAADNKLNFDFMR